MSDWKPAKKSYTKAQKRQRALIKEEFDWVMELANKPDHPMNPDNPAIAAWGGDRWISELMRLNDEYKAASDNRDELINNTMLLFATYNPALFDKVSNHPHDLTDAERELAKGILEHAKSQAPQMA